MSSDNKGAYGYLTSLTPLRVLPSIVTVRSKLVGIDTFGNTPGRNTQASHHQNAAPVIPRRLLRRGGRVEDYGGVSGVRGTEDGLFNFRSSGHQDSRAGGPAQWGYLS